MNAKRQTVDLKWFIEAFRANFLEYTDEEITDSVNAYLNSEPNLLYNNTVIDAYSMMEDYLNLVAEHGCEERGNSLEKIWMID